MHITLESAYKELQAHPYVQPPTLDTPEGQKQEYKNSWAFFLLFISQRTNRISRGGQVRHGNQHIRAMPKSVVISNPSR